MRKIFESELSTLGTGGESANLLIIFQLESEDDLDKAYEIDEMENSTVAWENWTELYNDWWPTPGSLFSRFTFRLATPFLIVYAYTAYNV